LSYKIPIQPKETKTQEHMKELGLWSWSKRN